MTSTRSLEAFILLTRDVGDADRFCILFTREAGKRAARANGVRKSLSRMGGMLLPLRHLRLEMRESGDSHLITAAQDIDTRAGTDQHFTPFAHLSEGIELLLRLTEDDEPLPAVFDLLLQFRVVCRDRLPEPVLPFQLCLLHHLGFLPVTAEDPRFARLSPTAQSFVWSCAHGRSMESLCTLPANRKELAAFRDQLLLEHLNRPLAAPGITEAMRRRD